VRDNPNISNRCQFAGHVRQWVGRRSAMSETRNLVMANEGDGVWTRQGFIPQPRHPLDRSR
jgi:hypothetical protein